MPRTLHALCLGRQLGHVTHGSSGKDSSRQLNWLQSPSYLRKNGECILMDGRQLYS